MSNLLLEVTNFRPRARTIFRSSLKIYEDLIVFRRRRWFTVDEMTVTFSHIAQCNLKAGIFFSTIEIITTGGYEKPSIEHIFKKPAEQAQKLIEQKIHRVHSTQLGKGEFEAEKDMPISNVEKSLSRLRELRTKGRISDKEYEKQRKKIVKDIG